VTAVAIGTSTCALLSGGTVECWGDNAYGELGNGTTTASATPVAVSGLTGVTAIATGFSSTCALLSGGTVKCWGYNADGELGNGTTTSSSIPVAVSSLSGATHLALSNYGFACAILSGGTIECWGSNAYGQLGDGRVTDSSTPVVVSGIAGATAVAVAEDAGYACALVSGGAIQCWGDNTCGNLGDGTTKSSSTPVSVQDQSLPPPAPLTGATTLVAGATTNNFDVDVGPTCVIASGGTVACWGGCNGFGQVDVSGLSGTTVLSAGSGFDCAIQQGGSVACWGNNDNGNLGNGTQTDSSTPVPVMGLSGVTNIVTSDGYACALMSSGGVECWGENIGGQLGDGTAGADSTIPVQVVW
jgi:alpha-tubulin suppressor-like RCC1 family protein